MSNKFKYDEKKGELWLDTEPPNQLHYLSQNSYEFFDRHYKEWQNRLHYTCSPKLKKLLKDGQAYELGEDFQVLYVNANDKERTALPLGEQTNDDKELTEMCMQLTSAFDDEQTNKVKETERLFTLDDLEDCWDACEKYHFNEMKHYSDRKNVAGKKEYLKAVIKNNKPNE